MQHHLKTSVQLADSEAQGALAEEGMCRKELPTGMKSIRRHEAIVEEMLKSCTCVKEMGTIWENERLKGIHQTLMRSARAMHAVNCNDSLKIFGKFGGRQRRRRQYVGVSLGIVGSGSATGWGTWCGSSAGCGQTHTQHRGAIAEDSLWGVGGCAFAAPHSVYVCVHV